MLVATCGAMGLAIGIVASAGVVAVLWLALAYDRRVAARARVIYFAPPQRPVWRAVPSGPPTLLGVGPDDLDTRRTEVFAAVSVPVAIAPEETPLARPPRASTPRPFARGTSAPTHGRAPTPTDVVSTRIDHYIADAYAALRHDRPTRRSR